MDPALAKKTSEPPLSDDQAPSPPSVRFPAEDAGKSLAEMAQRDLNATLQLLADRAQYITGATGAAIALRDSEEMVCRASAGTSAPEVGTQLQINSGLSGESVRTRQTLRCDDAHTDTRVNRESCEALGIRSVVVMPLLRNDEVIGVFELFSDQPNVFQIRDLAALDRMGAMVHTALEQSASAIGIQPGPTPTQHFDSNSSAPPSDLSPATVVADSADEKTSSAETVASPAPSASPQSEAETRAELSSRGIAFHMRMPASAAPTPAPEKSAAPSTSPAEAPESLPETEEFDVLEIPSVSSALPTASELSIVDDVLAETDENLPAHSNPTAPAAAELKVSATPIPEPVPEEAAAPVPASRSAVASLRKCEACGFPVSEGRQLCLDCEKKKKDTAPPPSAVPPTESATTASTVAPPSAAAPASAEEQLPNFLAGESEEEASWIASHKILLATILIALLAILGAFLLR